MGVIQRLKESIFGSPKEPIPYVKETGKAVLGTVEQTYGIYQIPSFREMVTTFWDDPVLRESIQNFAEQVVSTGFYLTSNPEYQLQINGKTALDVIKEWCDENNIDIKLLEIAIELRAFGNSFWRIDEQYGFVKIPIEAVWRAVPIDSTTPLQIKYNIQLTPLYQSKIIPWGEFIHFRVNVTGYRAPLGIGLIHSLIQKPVDSNGDTAPSIYDIRLQCRRSLHEGFRKFSFGNVYIGLPGMSNEDFTTQNIAGQISKLSSTGNRIVTNTDVKVVTEVPQRTESYDMFIKTMQDEFYISLGDPTVKLGLEKGFTKSTAIVASEFFKNKIVQYRKCIKQQFEDLFKQILDRLGYDGKKAGVQFNFGPEETPKYTPKEVLTAMQLKAITRKEARRLLSQYLKWELDPEEEEEIEKIDKKDVGKMNLLGITNNPEQMPGRQYEPLLHMKKEVEALMENYRSLPKELKHVFEFKFEEPKPIPVKVESKADVNLKTEPLKGQIEIKIPPVKSESKVDVNVKSEPIKSEVEIKTEPIKTEPLKVEGQFTLKEDKREVELLKEKLETEKRKQKALEKLSKKIEQFGGEKE